MCFIILLRYKIIYCNIFLIVYKVEIFFLYIGIWQLHEYDLGVRSNVKGKTLKFILGIPNVLFSVINLGIIIFYYTVKPY